MKPCKNRDFILPFYLFLLFLIEREGSNIDDQHLAEAGNVTLT